MRTIVFEESNGSGRTMLVTIYDGGRVDLAERMGESSWGVPWQNIVDAGTVAPEPVEAIIVLYGGIPETEIVPRSKADQAWRNEVDKLVDQSGLESLTDGDGYLEDTTDGYDVPNAQHREDFLNRLYGSSYVSDEHHWELRRQ